MEPAWQHWPAGEDFLQPPLCSTRLPVEISSVADATLAVAVPTPKLKTSTEAEISLIMCNPFLVELIIVRYYYEVR